MRLVANRSITIAGFVAELNPNTATGAAAAVGKTYAVKDRNAIGNPLAGLGIAVVFAKSAPAATFDDDVAAASISFVLWLKDSTASDWIKMTADTAIHRVLKTTADVRGPVDIFIQVTAINNVVAAETVALRVTEV